MKKYRIEIIELDGKKVLSIGGFVLYDELQAIKKKVGDIDKYPIGKKITVKI